MNRSLVPGVHLHSRAKVIHIFTLDEERLKMTYPTQTLTAIPAVELDDDALRRELAATHQLQVVVQNRGIAHELGTVNLRLAELDGEYLRRFPNAAHKWPWPLPSQKVELAAEAAG